MSLRVIVSERVIARLTGADAGSVMARRLLPAAVVAPLVVGWLSLSGQRRGWYDIETGLALFAVSNVVLFAVLVWWTAERLRKLDTAHSAELEDRVAERTAQLEQSEARFRGLVENAADFVVVLNRDGTVRYESPSIQSMLGFSPEEREGRSGFEHIHPDDVSRVIEIFTRGIQVHGTTLSAEFRARHKDGSWRTLEAVGTNLLEDPVVAGVVVNYRDVTARKALEEALREKNAELEAFSYSVSHDLRGPLRAIDGFTGILQTEHSAQLDPEAKRYLDIVRRSTQEMRRLIDDLLAFSRLGSQPVHKQHVAVADLVSGVLADLQIEHPGRRFEIELGDLPPCEADPGLMKQVLSNLLGNAFKYTRAREVARIEVGCRRSNGDPIYFVKDNGVGFDMQHAHEVFGVFRRLRGAEAYEGTGVGLAIVQRIVQRHGGRVWAEAAAGQGATFYFTV